MGHAYANYFNKAYIIYYRKCQKKREKFHRLISWQNPVKFKKNTLKKQKISIPYLLQAQPAIVMQYLACNCGSTTMYKRNDNCVDPNHTDS